MGQFIWKAKLFLVLKATWKRETQYTLSKLNQVGSWMIRGWNDNKLISNQALSRYVFFSCQYCIGKRACCFSRFLSGCLFQSVYFMVHNGRKHCPNFIRSIVTIGRIVIYPMTFLIISRFSEIYWIVSKGKKHYDGEKLLRVTNIQQIANWERIRLKHKSYNKIKTTMN